MVRRRRSLDPVEWLKETTEPGDLILTGSSDLLSWMIQWGTRSHVSHTAIVRSDEGVVEAYDFGLTPDESDEGVFEHSFEEMVDRSYKLKYLIVRRPRGWTDERRARFDRSLQYTLNHSPAFPTVGAGMASVLVILTRPECRRLRDRLPSPLRWLVDRLILWLANSVSDGPRRVHCSEIATRLLTRVGFELRFADPTLGPVVAQMPGGEIGEDGAARFAIADRNWVSNLPRIRRKARKSERPQVDLSSGSKAGSSTMYRATVPVKTKALFVAGTRGFFGTKRPEDREPTPDMADLILPADLERAEPFDTVGMLVRRGWTWSEEEHEAPPAS